MIVDDGIRRKRMPELNDVVSESVDSDLEQSADRYLKEVVGGGRRTFLDVRWTT